MRIFTNNPKILSNSVNIKIVKPRKLFYSVSLTHKLFSSLPFAEQSALTYDSWTTASVKTFNSPRWSKDNPKRYVKTSSAAVYQYGPQIYLSRQHCL